MGSRSPSRWRRGAAALLLAGALVFALAAPALAEGQTQTDTATIRKTTLDQAGQTLDDATSTALSGAATAIGQVQVHQIDVQVIAGPKATRDNSTQSATNTATVNQTTLALSGDAVAVNGGSARSGNASARSLTIVHQMNIQIIAGWAPAGGVTQTASNDATVNQTTGAVSGDAGAAGSGSTATSGDASASSVAVIRQRNFQLYVGKGPSGADDPVVQTATNVASIDQTTLAATGQALATGGGTAISGDAEATAKAIVDQTNKQVVKQSD